MPKTIADLSAKEKLEAVLSELWQKSRFTSYFYQSVDLVREPKFPTLALVLFRSRLALYYSDLFVKERSCDELTGLLVHEMLHIIMNHNHRALPDEPLYLQNLAQDMVINSYISAQKNDFFARTGQYSNDIAPLLLPIGLPTVPDAFTKETGEKDPSWERLYRWLKTLSKEELEIIEQTFTKTLSLAQTPDSHSTALEQLNKALQNPLNIPIDTQVNDSNFSFGDYKGLTFIDSEGNQLPTGVHITQSPENLLQLKAKKEGFLRFVSNDSRCLEERTYQKLTGLITQPHVKDTSPWRSRIKSLVDHSSQSLDWKYTHGRFNRRYFPQGIYASGRLFEEKEFLTVAVDVSGSVIMQPKMLESVFGVVDDLTRKYIVHLVCIDEQLFVPVLVDGTWKRSQDKNQTYIYRKGDWKHIKTGSMGTTFFSPLFNQHMKKHREVLLVITDGQIYDLDKLLPYQRTLWIIPEDARQQFSPPFGQVIPFSLQKSSSK